MLIKNSAELKANSETNSNVNYDAVKMSIKAAEKKYIIPIIGMAQYSALETAHNGGPITPAQTALILAIQEPLASLAMSLFVPMAEVSLSNTGARRTGTEELPGAYKYQTSNLKEALLERGLDFIEDLLLFLETNKADYPLWTDSDEFKEYRTLFVRSGSEYATFYTGVKHPRQTFMKLRAALLFVQENIIRPTILPDIYDDLQTKLATAVIGYTSNDKILVRHIQRAMVNLAMKEGMNDYALTIDNNGVTILSEMTDNTMGDVSKKKAATDSQLRGLASSLYNIGHTWLKRATDFLDETATDAIYIPWYEKMTAEAETKDDDLNENLSGSFLM